MLTKVHKKIKHTTHSLHDVQIITKHLLSIDDLLKFLQLIHTLCTNFLGHLSQVITVTLSPGEGCSVSTCFLRPKANLYTLSQNLQGNWA